MCSRSECFITLISFEISAFNFSKFPLQKVCAVFYLAWPPNTDQVSLGAPVCLFGLMGNDG